MSRKTYYTSTGKKRYLKLGKDGRIVDNQSYKRAHGADLKHLAKAERLGRILTAVDVFMVNGDRKKLEAKIKKILG